MRRSDSRLGALRSAVGITGCLLLVATSAVAQTATPPAPYDGIITLEIWSTDDRLIHGDEPVERRLLQEARYILAGLIHGWEFVYVPEYPARGVERIFELVPLGGVEWGDPRLTVRDLLDERTTLYGQLDYRLSDVDLARVRRWRNLGAARSVGSGSAPLLLGLAGKEQSIEEAIHRAIRDYLRNRSFNRPREATGLVVLAEPPTVRTVAGTYEARVSVLIHLVEVLEYRVF
ncbi:MAG: hypothetical protein MI724_03445 [Spirochaetales bacterium]|nr:hypothetical protein [Spirochaetales bacterium]